ncbi:MAG: hypothetical protein M3P51_07810 [Chloroflexota bacterium]|nr:hypothetical protein [Chloroflexota bacterium]
MNHDREMFRRLVETARPVQAAHLEGLHKEVHRRGKPGTVPAAALLGLTILLVVVTIASLSAARRSPVTLGNPECEEGMVPSPYIPRERAIDAAVDFATTAEFATAVPDDQVAPTEPRNIRAEFMTRGEMENRLAMRGLGSEDAERSIWLVTLEGETTVDPDDDGPLPVGFYRPLYSIMVDTITGRADLVGRWLDPPWQPIPEKDTSESDPPRCSPVFFLPRLKPPPREGGDTALLKGELAVEGDCLKVGEWTLVWPSDHRAHREGGRVVVLDGSGQVVGRTGDRITGGGGEQHSDDELGVDQRTQRWLEERCGAPYWIVVEPALSSPDTPGGPPGGPPQLTPTAGDGK